MQAIHVLFVCLGNICRSPAAQGIFEQLLAERGLTDVVSVDSCGTAPFNVGKHPDPRMIAACQRAGIAIETQVARQIADSDYARSDYIIAMDQINLTNVKAWAPADYRGEIALFMHYSQHGGNAQIADPYYEAADSFDSVVSTLRRAADGLLEQLCKKHGLLPTST